MKCHFFIGLLAAFIFTPALADYREEYRAYQAAVEAGDVAKAEKHAEKAWRDAEQELGASRLTAILAYNYAQTVAASDPNKAKEAFARALELADLSDGALDPADIRLRLALSNFEAAPDDRDKVAALKTEIRSYTNLGSPVSDASARAWLYLAINEFRNKKKPNYYRTRQYADTSLEQAREIKPTNTDLLVDALLYSSVARIANPSSTGILLITALERLNEAILLFPEQDSIDTYNPTLARIWAWRNAIGVLGASKNNRRVKEAFAESDNRPDIESIALLPNDINPSCKLNWKKRDAPKFPQDQADDGQVSSVFIGYDILGTGIGRSKVIAAIGVEEFSDRALIAMEKWVLTEEPPPECLKNRTIVFSYILER